MTGKRPPRPLRTYLCSDRIYEPALAAARAKGEPLSEAEGVEQK